jgi:polar amino acid transport system substrate-binding protein
MKAIHTGLLSTLLLVLFWGCQMKDTSLNRGGKQDTSLERVQKTGVVLWGVDLVANVPYVYEDPKNPGSYIGFEMEIANAIARQLGVKVKIVSKPWDTLIPELQRESFDMVMNGIEDTEERKRIVLFSDPYFVYSQQITVRKETKGVRRLEDLKGKKVATLSGTAAEDILRETPGIQVIASPDLTYAYLDLQEGRADAVLLDTPVAAAYATPNPKLKNVGETLGEGRYVIAFRMEDKALRDAVNRVLVILKKNGELKAIYTKWGIMDDLQEKIDIR